MVPPQSQLFSKGQECPWSSLGQVFSFVFLSGFSETSFYSLAKEYPQGESHLGQHVKLSQLLWGTKQANGPLTHSWGLWVQILDGNQNSKPSLMAATVQKQDCLPIIFSTFLRLVIMHFWFTVLMLGNCVTFILPCRITWEYSLERISHRAEVKKQDMQQAPRCPPISLKYKRFPGIKDSEIHSHKVKALLSK